MLQPDLGRIVLLARFTRNIVAGVPSNQQNAAEIVPVIQTLIHRYTSWISTQDDTTFPVTQALTQALSNIITANPSFTSSFWSETLKRAEKEDILIRLLGSPDAKTVLSSFVLILNCVHGSAERLSELTTSPMGVRICVCILDDMVDLHDAEEASDGAKAFDVGYAIISRMIEGACVPVLYEKLKSPGEIITPAQTTLLKLLDSALQSQMLLQKQQPSETPRDEKEESTRKEGLSSMLAQSFFRMSGYARNYLSGLDSSTSTLADLHLDVMLPKVCEALVLIAQCVVSICLEDNSDGEGDSVLRWRDFFDAARPVDGDETRMLESLIDLLRLLDIFLPRIVRGKPVSAHPQSAPPPSVSVQPNTPDSAQSTQQSAGAPPNTPLTPTLTPQLTTSSRTSLTSNSSIPVTPSSSLHDAELPDGPSQPPTPPTPMASATNANVQEEPGVIGFTYLKRDLVRLLGILVHQSKEAQDRARDAGGIQVVMNQCVIDERNPYLREHAIFTLSRLLEKNSENQAVVESMKPERTWDENGVLR